MTRTYLRLVPTGFKQLALRERLLEEASRHFPIAPDAPADQRKRLEAMRSKWVDARIALGDIQPKVTVGSPQPIRFLRQEPNELRKAKFK